MKFNKKIQTVILMAMMLVMVCACGKNNNSNIIIDEEKQNSQISKEEVENIEKIEDVGEEENSILTWTYKVPLEDLYIDVPDMHYMEEGYTQVFLEDQIKYILFTCLPDDTATDEKNALDITFESAKRNISGLHYINNLGEVTEEYTSINGIDVYLFEGKINCGETVNYDAYIRGYSFIYDEMPCSIIGVVMDEEQPQDQIDAIKEIVDAMILTVRSEQ